MMRIYLKKLVQTFLFLAGLIVLTALVCTLLIHLIFWFRPQVNILVFIGLAVSAVTMMYAVFLRRWENKSLRATYLENETVKERSFIKDYIVTFKTKENTLHTLAFTTIAIMNSVRLTITA